MAILSNLPNPNPFLYDVNKKVDNLENSIEELLEEFDRVKLEQEFVKQQVTEASLGTAFKNSLVFKDKDIEADNIWKGDVSPCFDKIAKEIQHKDGFGYDCGQLCYFGATSFPERRLAEHRKVQGNNVLGFSLGMNILYYSARMEKAASMETKLISRFGSTRNIKKVSGGLSFGRPAYFVYMLRYFIRK